MAELRDLTVPSKNLWFVKFIIHFLEKKNQCFRPDFQPFFISGIRTLTDIKKAGYPVLLQGKSFLVIN